MQVYLGGEYCPLAKRKAEMPWQAMVVFGSLFLGRAGVYLPKTAPEAYTSLPGAGMHACQRSR